MIKKNLRIYEFFVAAIGLIVPLLIFFLKRPVFPPVYEYLLFSIFALVSAYLGIIVKNTILSFEIVIYYFLILSFGPVIASITSYGVIAVLWIGKAVVSLIRREGLKEVFNTVRVGLYNAGVYGVVFLAGGFLYTYINYSVSFIAGVISSILLIVILNEVFFLFNIVLSGEKWLDYLKEEGIWSDVIEIAVYPFGIAMFWLYRLGFNRTVSILIGIIVLSYIGRLMSGYQLKLSKRLKEISHINEISRYFSGILKLKDLIKAILKETYNIVNQPRSCSIYIRSAFDGKDYFFIYNGEEISEKRTESVSPRNEVVRFPLECRGEDVGYLEIVSERKLGDDELVVAENISKQASISLSNAMMYMISIRDPLTGLYTRRHFESRLEEEISRAERTEQSFSLIMFDIDKLKEINDNHGHKVGDKVLRRFSEMIKKYTRPFDVSARWGGDEFILILPKTSEEQAREIGKRIANNFSGILTFNQEGRIEISASFACTEYKIGSGVKADEIFYTVDEKLIEIKKDINSD